MSALHYDTYTEARAHLKELLDAAEQGRPASVRRDASRAMIVDAGRLGRFLLTAYPSRARVVAEAGGWSAFIPGLPIAADGATFDEAITEMIDALREYADDWEERLYRA
ncbi:MAG: prevent-host-death protein, partial [Trebonia sp.]